MAATFSFRCQCCGEIHEGSPGIGFSAPDPYLEQPEAVRNAGALASDTCTYSDEDGPHFFIRVILELPIHGVTEPFLWGVWVSLSELSYRRYVETWDAPDPNDCYFGWLCNYLPYYENTFALKTHVHPSADGARPTIELEMCEHPLALDFHHGISVEKAQRIAEYCMHREAQALWTGQIDRIVSD